MYCREDLQRFCRDGERIYLTYLDGEDNRRTVGGFILDLIGDAVIFRVRTSADYDRTVVIYLHRLLKIESIQEKNRPLMMKEKGNPYTEPRQSGV